MIELPNGHRLEYLTASGAMGYDGFGYAHEQPLRWLGLLDTRLFTHVMKSVTRHPRKGNFRWWKPWDCVKPIWRNGEIVGVINAFGLTNPGFDWWAKNIGPKVDSSKNKVIGSIFGEPGELAEMAKAMNDFDLVALEYNGSCPNAQDDTLSNTEKVIRSCEIVANNTRHPVLMKLSVVHDIETIVPATENALKGFDVNSIPWHVFSNRRSPLEKFGGGGVSGKIAQPYTWTFARKLQAMANIPVIAPSMWEHEDIGTMRDKGFKVFSFGSVFTVLPWHPTLCVQEDIEALERGERL